MFVCIKQTFNITSCTTISVYVNLSKNLLKLSASEPYPSRRGGLASFADAKVQLFLKLTNFYTTFFKKDVIFDFYTLYIIYAREDEKACSRSIKHK